MKEIRLYVEGAKEGDAAKRLRTGMSEFLREVRDEARRRRVGWTVVACGHREDAYRDFWNGRARHPDALNLLLVDSEGPVEGSAREHLVDADRWELGQVLDDQVHLMVQAMEAWLIADPDALARFYGQGFVANAIPKTKNVETIPKGDLVPALERATRDTSKGKYHKTQHAFALLSEIDPDKVRARAPHCDRLFRTLLDHLAS